jgi:uncharacterized ferritin-like protein (DUF455 family)
MVLEARGLDVTPTTIERFTAVGDERSARILSRILADEIRHVRFGTSHFAQVCEERKITARPVANAGCAAFPRHC